jgi:arsenate reductase
LITIFHNPSCSKSRATLELLRSRGIEPDVVRYLETPPDETRLRELLRKLGLSAQELTRMNEPVARELHTSAMSEAQLLTTLIRHPILIERPIVENGERAVIGRPPEKVLEIL